MSDPIAEAAAQLSDAAPSSTEPVVDTGLTLGNGSSSAPNSVSGDMAVVQNAGVSGEQAVPVDTALAPGLTTNAPEVAPVGEPSSSLSSGDSGTVEAGNADAGTPLAGAATPASTCNVLLNAAPVVDAPVLEAGGASMGKQDGSDSLTPSMPISDELPRESHLMLLEHKFAAAVAKLRNAERVAVDELEAIWVHVKAVI